jgi:predicted acetyltransferase
VDRARSLAVFAGDDVLATLSAYVLDIGLPGTVDANATALVDIGVSLEHRGEGLARSLVTEFLQQAHRRGEALAVLNSDSVGLYERFGFGVATHSCSLRLSGAVARPPSATSVRLIEADQAAVVLPVTFEATRGQRVGEVVRTPAWWREHLADAARPPSPLEFAVFDQGGGNAGYAAFSRAHTDLGAAVISELRAFDDRGRLALVEFVRRLVSGVDVLIRDQPVDIADALSGEVGDVAIDGPHPQLWLRVIDLERAFRLRQFVARSSTVIEVRDDLLEWNRGRFLLETYLDHPASLAASAEQAALSVDVGSIAEVFLGGTSFSALAKDGEIEVFDEPALGLLDRAFSIGAAPYCSTLL